MKNKFVKSMKYDQQLEKNANKFKKIAKINEFRKQKKHKNLMLLDD